MLSYPSDRFDYQETFIGQRTHYQIWQTLYQYPVSAVKELRSSEEAFSNRTKPKTPMSSSSTWGHSQSEIVFLPDKEGKGFSSTFDLCVNGQVTVDRSQAGEQYAWHLVRLVLALSITKLLRYYLHRQVSLEIFINKGELFWSCLPHADQKRYPDQVWKPTGTYYELDYGRKTTWCRKTCRRQPTVSRVINKRVIYLKNHSQGQWKPCESQATSLQQFIS